MRMIKMKVVDSDDNNMIASQSNNVISETNDTRPTRAHNNSGYQTIKINLEGRTHIIHNSKSFSKSSSGKRKIDKQPVVTDKNQEETKICILAYLQSLEKIWNCAEQD